MTWLEFKILLENWGVKDDDKIWYFDIKFPSLEFTPRQISISKEEGLGIAVSN